MFHQLKMANALLSTLFILSGTSHITANEELGCQSGWYKYQNLCYWFSDFKATRNNAKLQCETRESVLVTIDNSYVNTFLEHNIAGTMSYWIGLRMDNITTYAWRWNTGGPLSSQGTDLYWCEDTDPHTACAVMYYAPEPCLKSSTCALKRPFICEKVLPSVSSCPSEWEFYSDNTPRCYYIPYQVKQTRMEAVRFCWNIGGTLVTVPSYLTKMYLTRNRPTTDIAHWVGLSPYKWDDGTPYNWDNWDNNGPDIGYKCTRLLPNGMWTYGQCSHEVNNFICEKEATMPVSTTERSTIGRITETFTTYSTTSSHGSTSSGNHPITTSHKHVISIAAELGDSLFSTGVPVKRFTSPINITDTYEAKTKAAVEKVTKKYLIIVGIMSTVIACTLGAVIGLVIYIKRKTVPKQQNPASQGVQYEDVSSAYYNVGADINKSCDVKIYENKDQNSDEQQQNETYEELTTVGTQKAEPGPYAVLK